MSEIVKTIYLASDHAGYSMKEQVKSYLAETRPKLTLHDLGTNSEASVHYPEFGFKAAEAVTRDKQSAGIIICGSGIGISIAANRVHGARAALCQTEEMARLAREHNDANILALGARLITFETAQSCVDAFLDTAFAEGRHQLRVEMLD